ncbi:uncharacterized protein LOC121380873 [Gigantopelta aegis]|uniref:uncharacterized protein LOC121380873 n=1 Tax=Gigantopelta aegis TaxID=1735272 RepID=UPI001B88B226|nr:uncharacterized protein LOC121380873 [Gigantopelta aegis]
MTMIENFSKPRVNTSMLPLHQGQQVCLLGMASNVDKNGTSFKLTTGDGKECTIKMQDPLSEYVAGLTEVHGRVENGTTVVCDNYIPFPEETSASFDLENYNQAVDLMSRFPDHYIQGVQE